MLPPSATLGLLLHSVVEDVPTMDQYCVNVCRKYRDPKSRCLFQFHFHKVQVFLNKIVNQCDEKKNNYPLYLLGYNYYRVL